MVVPQLLLNYEQAAAALALSRAALRDLVYKGARTGCNQDRPPHVVRGVGSPDVHRKASRSSSAAPSRSRSPAAPVQARSSVDCRAGGQAGRI